ncbi:1,4-alpha-glucan branching protein GlgB [Natronospora cellulosivora (SeqCode)]
MCFYKDMGISDEDLYLFHQGNLYYAYKMFGAHKVEYNGQEGIRFALWAPNAKSISIVGDFNNWDGRVNRMERINDKGVWLAFIPGMKKGTIYKYEILNAHGQLTLKSDPYAFYSELRPNTASIVYPLEEYKWGDHEWQDKKSRLNSHQEALSIYEVNLASWKKKSDGSLYSYRELADELLSYVVDMGYTHIELMPINEHPFDRSWGYQATGYFSVTSRFGTADDFRYFMDSCHQAGVGIILDWVPGHFCKDDHGLRLFDGTTLYEYEDSRKAEKAEWGTLSFDFGRNEVQSFLISNLFYFFEEFHIDGVRVDAVASMLYLNFGRDDDSIRNEHGGFENLEAISLLRKMNEAVFENFPGILMIAEESSDWPMVSAPTYLGGLGFNYKWNMGWMNDMLEYMEMDPIHRKWHHDLITFSLLYAFSENYVLPISHDELVYGKKSLLNKMPGDYWQKFANFRVFLTYMMTHPGKKLLFMGSEFAQFDEWKDLDDLDWGLLNFDMHAKAHYFTKNINRFYLQEKALWEYDHQGKGFSWIDPNNNQQSIISFIRKGKEDDDYVIVICNFTPCYYGVYRIGVPEKKSYIEVFNSDKHEYGGSDKINTGTFKAMDIPWNNCKYSIEIAIPPLAACIFKPVEQ